MKNIGFVGLGVMGAPMAAHLANAGYAVRVWNRTGEKADAFIAERAAQRVTRAATPAEAAASADAVVTILADDAALRQVTYGDQGLLAALPAGAVHISMSTASAEVTTELAEAHRGRGSELLAAPVFGSREAARSKKLWTVAAGPAVALERCRPLLEAMTQGVIYLGKDPAAAPRMKLLGNMLIFSAAASLVQAFTLGPRVGVPPEKMCQVINSVFNSPIYERYGSRLAEREFSLHFPLTLMLKDLNLMQEMGAAAGVPLPCAAAVREMVVAALDPQASVQDAAASLMQTWETLVGK